MTAALWPEVIGRLLRREELPSAMVEKAMSAILSGEATDAQIAAFAVGLRAKGETPAELATLVRTMLGFAERVDVSDLDAAPIDTCGTGGDRAGTVNVSTMAAIVAVAAGARVAKHGGRAATSQCGSTDVLEALGVVIDLGPDGVARCVREAGIGFCFAQRYHSAMRFAAPVRREIGAPTTFNFLGPLANPAGVRRQVVGVSDPTMADRVIGTLQGLGSERVLVFYGHDGLDELTVTTTSTVHELRDGDVARLRRRSGLVRDPARRPHRAGRRRRCRQRRHRAQDLCRGLGRDPRHRRAQFGGGAPGGRSGRRPRRRRRPGVRGARRRPSRRDA